MMATFPKLTTGAVAQYPSARNVVSATTVLRYVDGTEQRFQNSTGDVRRWVVRLSDVSAEELYTIEAFFIASQGQFASFGFTDPWSGAEYPDCSFESGTLELESFAEGRCSSTLIIRNNQV